MRTRQVSMDVKWMYLEQAESFTSDQVTSAIKSYRNSRAYGPGSPSIFHLKDLGSLATEHLTSLHNDSLKSFCRSGIPHLSSRLPSPTRTHRKTRPTDPSRCYVQQPRSSKRSSYPLSTNLSHQQRLTRLQTQTVNYMCPPPAHNRLQDRLQPAETTPLYSVCAHGQDRCL